MQGIAAGAVGLQKFVSGFRACRCGLPGVACVQMLSAFLEKTVESLGRLIESTSLGF